MDWSDLNEVIIFESFLTAFEVSAAEVKIGLSLKQNHYV